MQAMPGGSGGSGKKKGQKGRRTAKGSKGGGVVRGKEARRRPSMGTVL